MDSTVRVWLSHTVMFFARTTCTPDQVSALPLKDLRNELPRVRVAFNSTVWVWLQKRTPPCGCGSHIPSCSSRAPPAHQISAPQLKQLRNELHRAGVALRNHTVDFAGFVA